MLRERPVKGVRRATQVTASAADEQHPRTAAAHFIVQADITNVRKRHTFLLFLPRKCVNRWSSRKRREKEETRQSERVRQERIITRVTLQKTARRCRQEFCLPTSPATGVERGALSRPDARILQRGDNPSR